MNEKEYLYFCWLNYYSVMKSWFWLMLNVLSMGQNPNVCMIVHSITIMVIRLT